MRSQQDTLDELSRRTDADLRGALERLVARLRLEDDEGRVWSLPPLRDLPGYASDASGEPIPEAVVDEVRDAHHLGVIHAWHLDRGDVDPDDARLRGVLFASWRDALVRCARVEATRVYDRIAHAMRWMSWGRSNARMAERAGRWTLPEYQRSLRWQTSAHGLAAGLLVARFAPAKRRAFERLYEQLVLGLAQTTAGATTRERVHELLGCDRADLIEAGLLDLKLAGIDADALAMGRVAAFCRAHAAAIDELQAGRDPVRSGSRSKRPTAPAMRGFAGRAGGEGA